MVVNIRDKLYLKILKLGRKEFMNGEIHTHTCIYTYTPLYTHIYLCVSR